MREKSLLFLIALLAAVAPTQLAAQGVTGTIIGVAKDSSGAVVPGAKITLVQPSTQFEYSAKTDAEGRYTVRALPIGVYNLKAEAPGFKTYEALNIQLQVNENPRVDIRLEVGQVTESVEVAASVVNVDTQTATLKSVVDERRIEQLPLNGRDATQLARLVVGVQAYQGADVTSDTTYPGVVPISVNGGRGNTVNYILDGAQNNDHYSNAPSPMPNPDALAEFSVQTNNFSAEFGRNSGGVVNAVTKSGTNQLHGSGFGYLRHHNFNAGNFFAPPSADDPTKKQDDGLKRAQFGATLGGPVLLPKLYDGRNKTFFFFSYQGTRIRRQPSSQFSQVYTSAERNGNFSGLLPGTPLRDPYSNSYYPGNIIPLSRFNSATKYIVDHWMPQATIGDRRIVTSTADNFNDDQYLVKGDQNIGHSNKLSGRFYLSQAATPAQLNPSNYYEQLTGGTWRNTSLSISDTHIFGPAVINVATFGYLKTRGAAAPILPSKGWADLGVKATEDTKAPQLRFDMQGALDSFNTSETEVFLRQEFQYSDILRWSTKKHQISFGGEYGNAIGDNAGNYLAGGRPGFSNDAGFTGYAPADFFIGQISYWRQGLGEFKNTRIKRMGLFFEDAYRATSRLTLNLGLRWEPFFPYTDALGKLSVWAPGEQSKRFPNAPAGVLYPGDPGLPDGGYGTRWKNFAPRLGFALDLTGDGKTSLRGGYGIFYDAPNSIATNSSANQGPFGTQVTVNGNGANSLLDPFAGFPGGNPFTAVGQSAVGTDALNPGANVVFVRPHEAFVYSKDMRNAYSQSWNLTIERDVVADFIVRASYAGSKGTALVSGRDINAPFPNALASTSTTAARRPLYPNFGRITLIEGVGNSQFNALQLTAEKRFSRGFTVNANYMWSKSMDNNQGSSNKGNGTSVTNPLNQAFDRGPSDFDKTHVFNFSSLWDLPVKFDNYFTNLLLGGWSLSTIAAVQSGSPFTIFSGTDSARTGQDGQRADLIGNPYVSGGTSSRLTGWLNAAAFTDGALGTYGNLGRNPFRGPGFANVDLGLHKRFPITETVSAEFRFEAFNVFNRANFANPDNDLSSSYFLQITEARDPRILQFAVRLAW